MKLLILCIILAIMATILILGFCLYMARGKIKSLEKRNCDLNVPTDIDKRFGPRSEKEVKRRIEAWAKRTLHFLESKPICFSCGEELYHFSHTMLCDVCRPKRNYRRFVARNPLYNAQKWQRTKARQLMLQRRRRLTQNMDEINRRRRIKRREKRRNYEDSLRFKLGRLERDARKVIDNCAAT